MDFKHRIFTRCAFPLSLQRLTGLPRWLFYYVIADSTPLRLSKTRMEICFIDIQKQQSTGHIKCSYCDITEIRAFRLLRWNVHSPTIVSSDRKQCLDDCQLQKNGNKKKEQEHGRNRNNTGHQNAIRKCFERQLCILNWTPIRRIIVIIKHLIYSKIKLQSNSSTIIFFCTAESRIYIFFFIFPVLR